MNAGSRSGEENVKRFPPSGRLVYRPGWLAPAEAGALLDVLHEEIDWRSRTIRLFGREVMQPRRLAFQGDAGISYAYSGSRLRAGGWHPAVAGLKARLAAETGTAFNCVLLNLYRDGADCMGWHADDEPELGRDPVIASLSLGAPRRFVLRCRRDPGHKWEITPASGSLILMDGDLQHHWQHALPRSRRVDQPRINLTFRLIRDR